MTMRVTDHAIIRYLQRVKGLDVEAIRDHIATVCRRAHATGAVAVRAEGVRFILANQATTVVTVEPDTLFPSLTTQRKAREAGLR